jgi:hypothetical protein
MDQAEANKRRQDIIEAVKGIVLAVIALIPLFWMDLITAQQMGGLLILIGVIFVALQVVLGRQSLREAEAVEALVTPSNNPKDDEGNMLTPGTIGSDEADLPPI